MSANPTLENEDGRAILGELIEGPPTAQEVLPIPKELLLGKGLAAAPHLANFRLEFQQTFRGDRNPSLASEAKTEEFAFPGAADPAFERIEF